ncbi:MAG: hypothetical protein JXB48_13585 [Candidatus Latescibacteria bacterium]|nr:hypothetical protein [Candidatus Latescibacterota bacterium]
MKINNYDFCIAWNWEYDADFVCKLNELCHTNGLSIVQVTPENLTDFQNLLNDDRITFRVFFDRASDTDKRFIQVDQWARDHNVYRPNAYERAYRTWNKATMHLELITAGVHTPYTIIIPPYEEQPEIDEIDLSPLGKSFFIKPAHGGGGEGITREATTFNQVLIARRVKPDDTYLLQAHVYPVQLGIRPAWFRVISCTGQIYLSWWDPHTHIYIPLTPDEESLYNLTQLRDVTSTIADVCNLELFSTEIALTSDCLFVVVDYVNDQIDLRLKSKAHDGVPDEYIQSITKHLIDIVKVYSYT